MFIFYRFWFSFSDRKQFISFCVFLILVIKNSQSLYLVYSNVVLLLRVAQMFAIIDQQWNNLVYIRKYKRNTKAVAKYSINKKDNVKIIQWEYIEIIYNKVNFFEYKRWVQKNSCIKATKKKHENLIHKRESISLMLMNSMISNFRLIITLWLEGCNRKLNY